MRNHLAFVGYAPRRLKMSSPALKQSGFLALIAALFLGVLSAEGVQARPAAGVNPVKWLTNMATVFTDAGKAWAIDKFDETVQTTADHIGWGTGVGTAVVGDTTLFTEDSGGSPTYARVTATRTQQTTSVTGDTVRWVGTITSNGTKTITNAGNFTASTSGTLIVKGDFTGIALVLNDSIEFTINLQMT